jgi:hypothetical protein
MDAVQTHGGKNWGAIAALVPGRGESQCYSRCIMPWIPLSAERMDVRVNSQKTKASSCMIQFKCAVARVGVQLPLWFLVERKRKCWSRWHDFFESLLSIY